MKKEILAICLTVCSGSAAAHSKGFYVGLGLGEAMLTSQTSNDTSTTIVGSLVRTDQRSSYHYDPAHGFLGEAFLGYQINSNFAVEFSYQHLANLSGTRHVDDTYAGGVASVKDQAFSVKTQMAGVSVLGFKTMTPKIRLFGRVGAMWSQQRFDLTQPAITGIINNQLVTLVPASDVSETKQRVDLQYGLGATYVFDQRFSARVEARGIELKIGRTFEFTAGVSYKL